MQLISTLQEASSHPVDDLKKVMSKDARVKQVFQKHLDLDDIQNKPEFLNTIKFFLLNNRNVIDFVEGRDYVKDLDKNALKKLRELKPNELTQKNVDALVDFVRDLFREHSHVERSGISSSVRKEILDWVNSNGRFFDLSRATQRELESVPGVRPERPLLVYRGLLFSSSDLKERKRYDGTIEVGRGLKFLRSIREGSRVVDLEWDRPSAWSTNKQTAMQFARFGPASSNFDATMQWLSRKGHIDGDLGFIISTLARPEDILISIDHFKTSAHIKHGDEGEVILKAGEYTCRVSTKYTKEKGEVDPIKSGAVDETIQQALDAAREFARSWSIDKYDDIIDHEGWSAVDVGRSLRQGKTEELTKLAQKGTKADVIARLAELKQFYHDHLEKLSPEQLDTLQADKRFGKLVEWMNTIRKEFEEEERHAAHKTSENPKGKVKKKNMTPEQIRETGYAPLAGKMEDFTKGTRFTDWGSGSALNDMLRGFGAAGDKDIHRRGRKEQGAEVDKLIDAFYNKINVEKPADRDEAIKKMKSVILSAERTGSVLSKLVGLRKELSDASQDRSEESK